MSTKMTDRRLGNVNIGFAGLLAILFIGLKLGGQIDWSWVWVLAPLWIPFAIFLVILLLALVGTILVGMGRR